jgi:hypothetical protein
LGGLGVLLLAIQLSYTRAAYAAIVVAAAGYFMIRWRLTRPVLLLAAVAAVLSLNYLSKNERYLALAPNYERTITHTDFNNLIEATYQLEDISTMERVYTVFVRRAHRRGADLSSNCRYSLQTNCNDCPVNDFGYFCITID